MPASVSPWEAARQSARIARASLLSDHPNDAPPASLLIARGVEAAGLTLQLLPPTDPLLSGAHALLDPELAAVWVRQDATPELRAVYVAHELAHFYLHENGDICRCSEPDFADIDGLDRVGYGPRQRRETEANVWAREFLLPADVAHRLFFAEGVGAREIAARVGLGLGVVYGQLGEGLVSPSPPGPLSRVSMLHMDDAVGEGESGNAGPTALVQIESPVSKADFASTVFPPLPDSPSPTAWERGPGGEGYPLDPSQSTAAYAPNGPLLVGAGPGTGKTRTLTARVLYLTRARNVRPENILALTFSRKAADEMRERIGQQDAEVGRRAAISTFHAYGLDLLRRHGAAAGLPPQPVLLDLTDACALLERRVGALGLTALRYLHDPAFPLPDILRAIGRAKEDLVTPADFERRARATGDPKLADVARVYPLYEEMLREVGALDFADLICRALRLLTDNAAVRNAEQAQWQHVLVDEYQDVNRAGALLVGALSGRDANAGLWAVGDLRQAIYRFRGASPANVTRFGTDFPNGQRTELTVNYRSQPALVRLFGRTSGDGPTMWTPSRPATVAAPAVLAVAEDDTAQADGIATRMHNFAAEGIAWSDQVALCRTRGQARALRAALTERGVPVAPGADENNLLADRDVRTLLALLSRVCEPRGPARHLWPEIPPGFHALRNRAGGCDAYDLLTEALWGEAALARSLHSPAAVAALLGLARGFRDRAPLLTQTGDDPTLAFLAHLRRMVRLGASLTAADENAAPPDAVRVLTVHASKGLEFPVVFVPNLSAGKFPTRPMPSLLPELPAADDAEVEIESELAEEERLFFVALTRARDYLVLSRAQKYGRMSAKASPLLAAVEGAEEWGREVWVGLPSPPSPLSRAAGEGESGKDGKTGLATFGFASALSVGASVVGSALPDSSSPAARERGPGGEGNPTPSADLDLYLRCPRRYYYRRVLGLPEGDPTPYAAFKRAVTEALATADPDATLNDNWSDLGPQRDHPHASLYRQAADEIVARGARLPASPEPPTLAFPLEHGVVTVQPDAVTNEGRVFESRTFRKPPADETGTGEAAADRRMSLLQAAAETSGKSTAPTVHLRYLQTGAVRPIADKPKQRAKHLMEYDNALRGIQLKVFTPTPDDAGDCAGCPYFFICPE